MGEEMIKNKNFNKKIEEIKKYFSKEHKKIKDYLINKGILKKNENNKETKLVGFRMREVIILIIITLVISMYSGAFFAYNYRYFDNKNTDNNQSEHIDKFEEAFEDITSKYYGEIDKDKLIDAAINGMVSSLDDYSSYMDPEEARQFNERMYGQYTGIGIEFTSNENNEHTVSGVFEGSPAMNAGLKVGDKIIKIDDIMTSTQTSSDIATYIKSPNIKSVKIVIVRDGEELTLDIIKDTINIPSVSKKTFTANNKKVGYIKISIFANNTAEQFRRVLEDLEKEGITGLIIDVRTNSGGYLHVTKEIVEMFLPQGTVMYQIESKSKTDKYYDSTNEKRTYPVVVLTNKISASASEILAAALKETYGATVIGTTTYGKGTVQKPYTLSNGAVLKLTIEKWLTPTGNSIEGVGVPPTIEVLLSPEYGITPSDENDDPLQKGIETITK